jgi:hypothetical protein
VSTVRFVFYGRLSTTDKQDPALSFPSQLKACERKVAELVVHPASSLSQAAAIRIF